MPDISISHEPTSSLMTTVSETTLCWLDVTRRMERGDSSALAIYYERMFDLMLNEVRRLASRDEQTSLDIVQDAMLKAIRSIKPLPNVDAVTAWSRVVAKTTTFDWLRRNARRAGDESIQSIGDGLQMAPVFNDDERMAWIAHELQALPNELQRLISFRFRLGWSLKRIGQKFGLKTGAVDGRIRRAIEQLQEKAKREFDE